MFFQRCLWPIKHNAEFIRGTFLMYNEEFIRLLLDHFYFHTFQFYME